MRHLLTPGRSAIGALLVVCAGSVCAQAPLSFPAVQEYAAQLVQMNGQVSLMRGREAWALKVGEWVQRRQEIVTGNGGYALFQVNDGSTFEVFPNSRVIFRNNSGDWKDLLDLFLGRVKVHVQKFGGQPNPNRVTTPTAVISVRGTIFDVQIEDEDSTTLVLVEEGQVAIRHALIPQSQPKLVNQGEYLRVFKTQPLARSTIDKGSLLRRALQTASDAVSAAIYRMPRNGTGAGAGSPAPAPGGGGLPGDTGSQNPPPPPPPGPPPPPPPQ